MVQQGIWGGVKVSWWEDERRPTSPQLRFERVSIDTLGINEIEEALEEY